MIDYVYNVPAGRPDAASATHMLVESLGWQEYRTACGRTLKGAGVHKGASIYREAVDCTPCRRTAPYREARA